MAAGKQSMGTVRCHHVTGLRVGTTNIGEFLAKARALIQLRPLVASPKRSDEGSVRNIANRDAEV